MSPLQAWGESSQPFRVGLVLPLTGTAADYGIAIKNSIDLAQKDRPDLFKSIQFHYEDAAFDPKIAVSALSKLADGEEVDLVATWGASDQVLSAFASVKSREGYASGPYKYVNDASSGQYFRFPVVVKKIVKEGFEVVG